MAQSGRAFRFARNVGWNFLGQASGWTVSFFLVPYLIRLMGTEDYGLYILLNTVPSTLLLLSLGAGSATVKYIAELRALDDPGGLARVSGYSFWIHGLGVFLGAAVFCALAPYCAGRVFHVPDRVLGTGIFLLRSAAAGAICFAVTQYANAVFQGLHRFDLANALNLAPAVLVPLGSAGLMAWGRGLRAVACWYAVFQLLLALGAMGLVRRFLPAKALRGAGRAIQLAEFLTYSLKLWLAQLAGAIVFYFDKLFISYYLSLSQLTFYAAPAGILTRLQVVPASMVSVLLPMASEVAGPSAEQDLVRMYLRTVRALLWAVLPGLVILFALMPQFLTLWLGSEFGRTSVWPARLLVMAQGAVLLAYAPSTIAIGRGRPEYHAGAAWAQAVICVLGWLTLIPRYQILGAAGGFLLSQILPLPAFLWVVHRRILRLPFARYWTESLFAPLASSALLLALVFPVHHRVGTWLQLVSLAAAGGLLYYAATWFLFPEEDRELVRQFLRYKPASR